jgi:predicted GIY-YIG superfamily endonuclease
MKYYVYAVNNKDTNQTLRIGETKDLRKRLWRYTQKPFKNKFGDSLCVGQFHGQNIELIVIRECETKEESRKWEGIFKQLLGFEWTERTRASEKGRQRVKELYSQPVLAFRKDTGEFVGEYPSQMETSRQLGLNQGCISRIIKGKLNHTNGYTFRLAPK